MAKARIMIVEDESIMAVMIEKRLQRMGYTVCTRVFSGEEAVRQAASIQPDLVLMDIQLQGHMDGIEAAEEIQTLFDIPVIYLTACDDEETLLRARITEPFGYLIKPFSERELHTVIEIALYKHKAEKKLRENQQWFAAILKSIGEAVIATNKEGSIRFINPVAEMLTGWKSDDVVGKDIVFKIMEKPIFPFVERSHQFSRKTLEINITDQPVLITGDGTEIPIEYSGAPIKDSNGIVAGFVLVLKDIRERKQAEAQRCQLEAQLRQAQKLEALGILAGGIAHDFNNILGTILGYTELLLEEYTDYTGELEYLEQIYQAGERAAELVRQILTFSRVQEQQLKPILVAPLIREALKMIRATLPATVEIKQNLQANCPPVVADATQIHQVIVNLCANAGQAMKAHGGALNVSLEKMHYDPSQGTIPDLSEGLYLKLTIDDTGCGMSADVQNSIFDPFFTTKAVGEGTGLGLSVVHGIVRSHHGVITVSSEPGKGSSFQIFLPVTGQEKLQPEVMREEFVRRGRESILIVDDEPALAKLYEIALTELGYRVTTLHNGYEALERFQADPEQFDVVFTDQSMPKMTGAQLSQKLLQIRAGIPIILTTGYSDTISEEEAKAFGIRQYLKKPVKLHTLIQSIQAILG